MPSPNITRLAFLSLSLLAGCLPEGSRGDDSTGDAGSPAQDAAEAGAPTARLAGDTVIDDFWEQLDAGPRPCAPGDERRCDCAFDTPGTATCGQAFTWGACKCEDHEL